MYGVKFGLRGRGRPRGASKNTGTKNLTVVYELEAFGASRTSIMVYSGCRGEIHFPPFFCGAAYVYMRVKMNIITQFL